MNRGSFIESLLGAHVVSASMRPRFMNRGSSTRLGMRYALRRLQ